MKIGENSYLYNRLIMALNYFMGISFGFLILFLALRWIEFTILKFNSAISIPLFLLELKSIQFDLFMFGRILAIAFVPSIILYLIFSLRLVNFLLRVIGIVLLLFYLILLLYFSTTMSPLGADLFGYTYNEIELTVGASGALSFFNVLLFLIFIIFTSFIVRKFTKIDYHRLILIPFLLFLIGSYFFPKLSKAEQKFYATEIEYFCSANKLAYFEEQSENYFNASEQIDYVDYYIEEEHSESSIKYIDSRYPFLHIDSSKDVLGSFFNKSNSLPNIVFIVVESLGKSYSGEFAEYGSFTPFLDSLSKSSLYWPNFLSAGGRTFAVLPSVFASLPFAKKGFLELGKKMPNHQSLIRILNANGYHSSFYHGGNSDFDFMNTFLKDQPVDKLFDQKNFSKKFKTMPKNAGGFTWGYGDLELFKQYFQLNVKTKKPRLEIFLTLSNHNPFKVLKQDKYLKKFYEQLNNNGQSESQNESYLKQKEIFSCVLYSDDAIRYFINEYKKRPDFNNTIFIITGDHRMPEIPLQAAIDRFRVPFIIYSPLLKQGKVFNSVSSHLDITPTLLAYLASNYQLQKPSVASWVGDGIDTLKNFRNRHSYPLMRNKNELVDYIDNSNFIVGDRIYELKDGLKLAEYDDVTSLNKTKFKFDTYKNKNRKATSGNFILPDSVYNYSVIK